MGSRTSAYVVPWWLAGADRPEEFESRTEALYDEEQQRAILTAAGVAWRRQLKLVGILVRTAPADGRAAIRRREDEVDKLLPETPASPIKLRASLSELLPGHPSLVGAFVPRLTDFVAAPGADQETVLALAAEHGVETHQTRERVAQGRQGEGRRFS